MDKLDLRDLNLSHSHPIFSSSRSNVCFLEGYGVLKLFSNYTLAYMHNLEEKILYSKETIPQVITPNMAIYYKKRFCGYVMPCALGESFDKYNMNKKNHSLYEYAVEFSRLEELVMSIPNIVFPDLISCNNIFINFNDGRVDFNLIDYDGMQVDDFKSYVMSTSLGDRNDYVNSKYMNNDLFTKQLDLKSLMYLYIYFVFGCDMYAVGNNVSSDFLVHFLNCFGIADSDIIEKIILLYDKSLPNSYFGETLYEIALKYDLVFKDGMKCLVKKGECDEYSKLL